MINRYTIKLNSNNAEIGHFYAHHIVLITMNVKYYCYSEENETKDTLTNVYNSDLVWIEKS